MGTVRIFSIWWFLFIFFIKWQRWCKVLYLINCNHEKKFFSIFLMERPYYTLNWPNFIALLLLLFEILVNMCFAIVCYPGFDVIDFEINLTFLIKPFFYGCLYIPAPSPLLGPQPWSLALAPNLYLPALAPNLYLSALALTLCLPALALNLYLPALAPTLCLPQICIYRLSPGPEFAYTDLVSPICTYWPWPTICTHTGC